MKRLKQIYIFVFIIVLGLLILPQFNLKIGENEFQYPNIDFSSVNSSATLGNFSRGYDLYDSKMYTATVNVDSTLTIEERERQLRDLVEVIRNRINYSNLHDIYVSGVIENDTYKLNLSFPDYIQESDIIAKYLVGKGEIFFENDPQVSQTGVALKDTDIVGQIKSIYDEQYGNVLSFKFANTALTNFYFALQNTNNYFLMRVDSTYFAVIQDPNYTNTQSLDLQTSAIAVPFAEVKLSPNVAMYTNIVRSYFLTSPLVVDVNLDPNFKTIKIDFVADKISYIAIFIVEAVALLMLMYASKKGMTKTIKFVLMLGSYMVLLTFLLKLLSATLSVNLLLGFILGLIIVIYAIEKLLSIEEDQQRTFLNVINYYCIFIALVIFTIYRFLLAGNTMTDAFGTLLASVISLLFLSYVNFKFILDLEPNFKPFRKRL